MSSFLDLGRTWQCYFFDFMFSHKIKIQTVRPIRFQTALYLFALHLYHFTEHLQSHHLLRVAVQPVLAHHHPCDNWHQVPGFKVITSINAVYWEEEKKKEAIQCMVIHPTSKMQVMWGKLTEMCLTVKPGDPRQLHRDVIDQNLLLADRYVQINLKGKITLRFSFNAISNFSKLDIL